MTNIVNLMNHFEDNTDHYAINSTGELLKCFKCFGICEQIINEA